MREELERIYEGSGSDVNEVLSRISRRDWENHKNPSNGYPTSPSRFEPGMSRI